MENIDIIDIDLKIKKKFKARYDNLKSYKSQLDDLKITQNKSGLSHIYLYKVKKERDKLEKKILIIEDKSEYFFYISESSSFLEEYKKILQTPIKMNFMGKPHYDHKEKNKIINKYLKVVSKYTKLYISSIDDKTIPVCFNCNKKTKFDILNNNTCTCVECGFNKEMFCYMSSYKDTERANISSKYTYDRKVHFRDCINQYQGKQNCTIDKEVYEELEYEFSKHHLLVGKKTDKKEIRFSIIEKEHIFMFLKELGYNKHYENINLIHYNFTGIKPDDISQLEDILLNDFDELTNLYDKKFRDKIDRVNFINTHHVLYQLLKRHKHPCKKEDFSILKTIDRQAFHDNIMYQAFSLLGWNYDSHF